jgi:hypothetical protein
MPASRLWRAVKLRKPSTTVGLRPRVDYGLAGKRTLVRTIKFFGEVQGPKFNKHATQNWNALILSDAAAQLGANVSIADAAYDSLTLNNMTLRRGRRLDGHGRDWRAAKALQGVSYR